MSANVDSTLSQQASNATSENSADEGQQTYDAFVKWAPLVVPLFGALLALTIFLIDWSVLRPAI